MSDETKPRNINEALAAALEAAAAAGDESEEEDFLVSDGPPASTVNSVDAPSSEESSKIDPAIQAAKDMAEAEANAAAILDDCAANFDTEEFAGKMSDRAKYIPLRLTYEERKNLRLVNASIKVSDYTTAVDVEFKSKSKRKHTQLQHICAFLTGRIR
jgi:hypothetical protein